MFADIVRICEYVAMWRVVVFVWLSLESSQMVNSLSFSSCGDERFPDDNKSILARTDDRKVWLP